MEIDRFKVRAWLKLYEKMVEVKRLDYPHVMHDLIQINKENEYNKSIGESLINNCILMQCTGITDSEGKLIWEGDILFINQPDQIIKTSYYQVEWWGCDGYPAFDISPLIADDCNSLQYALIEFNVKVVGNIYETEIKKGSWGGG